MSSNEPLNSQEVTGFRQNGEISKATGRKRLLKIVGGAFLATAVAFGGGAALSQVPNSTAQGSPAQTTQVASQSTSATPIPSTDNAPAVTPVTGIGNPDAGVTNLPGDGNARTNNRQGQVQGGPGRGGIGAGR